MLKIARSVFFRAAILILPASVAFVSTSGGVRTEANARGSTSSSSQLVVAVLDTPNTLDAEFATTPDAWEMPLATCSFLDSYTYKPGPDGVQIPDPSAPFLPGLAQRWSFSNHGRTITFQLRRGVRSQFGNLLTAQDVKWSWDRAFALKAVGIWMFQSAEVTSQKDIRVLGPNTLSVTTQEPTNLFLANQAIPQEAPCILDYSQVKKHITASDPWAKTWLGTHSAGFGPYEVSQFIPGNEVVLKANPNYYGSKPNIGTIVYKAVGTAATEFELLKTGNVQIAEDLTPTELQQLKGDSQINVLDFPGTLGVILGLNNKIAPFNNKLVREAIAYASPIGNIIKTVYPDDPAAKLFKAYTPPTFPGHTNYWPYLPSNMTRAKQLLREAGQGPFTMTLTYDTAEADAQEVAVVEKSALANLGVTVQLQADPPAAYSQSYLGRTAQSVLVEDSLWNPDPGYGLELYYTPASHADWINYDNPTVSTLINKIRKTLNASQEDALARTAYKMIVNDAPWAFQIGTGYELAMSSKVGGFHYHYSNIVDVSSLYFKKS